MEKFKFDVVSQTLTITAMFDKQMANPMSEEYKLVMQFRADFPNLTIARKSNLEAEVFAIMEKSLKTALDVALDDIFKDWK